MDVAFVYILRCADGNLYTGVTRGSVEARVSEHNAGLANGYTAKRRPVELIYSEAHLGYDEAVAAERRIKGWSRAKKVALMRSDFAALLVSARCRAKRPKPSSCAGRGSGRVEGWAAASAVAYASTRLL